MRCELLRWINGGQAQNPRFLGRGFKCRKLAFDQPWPKEVGASRRHAPECLLGLNFEVHETQVGHGRPQAITVKSTQGRAGDNLPARIVAKQLDQAIQPARAVFVRQGNASPHFLAIVRRVMVIAFHQL